jgi:sec-independent protein translocase protein TatB
VFNVGPLELVVLAIVGLIVIGPDKLPGLAKDAARMIRTLRDLAQGARTQLRDELGPEFADIDLRSLNPRTAIQNMVLGDDFELRNDLRKLNPKSYLQDMILGDEAADRPAPSGSAPVSMTKPTTAPGSTGGPAPFDPDTT